MREKSELDYVISKIPLIDEVMGGKLPEWLKIFSQYHNNFKKEKPKEQLAIIKQIQSLVESPGEITEIKITKSGVDYHFSRNEEYFQMHALFEKIDDYFKGVIDHQKKRGITLYEDYFQALTNEEHHTDMAKLFISHASIKTLLPSERQRHLLMWELYRRAGYPFDKQQLESSDQNKASFIRNWFKRNKNQKFTG
jgi:hypothetical protein